MSDNKLKYWMVNTTSIVRANNKTEAEAIALRQRGFTTLDGGLVETETVSERISANVAQNAVAAFTA